jgi:hypothetical protein
LIDEATADQALAELARVIETNYRTAVATS